MDNVSPLSPCRVQCHISIVTDKERVLGCVCCEAGVRSCRLAETGSQKGSLKIP